MSFQQKNLSVLAYANGFTQWHYRSQDDTANVIIGTDYFNGAVDMLRAGDMIIVNAKDLSFTVFVQSADGNTQKVTVR